MRFIKTKTHGHLDYLMGILLITSPWALNYNKSGAETWVAVILGAVMILYSLLTNYELGLSKTLSMRTHLKFDLLGGVLLTLSPWLFSFHEDVSTPHGLLGILEIGAALLTKTYASNKGADDIDHKTATAY